MNVEAFRHLFGYHFAENRTLWGYIAGLSEVQYTQAANYSHGSVRDQVQHLVSVDDAWFSDLRGSQLPGAVDPAELPNREQLRAYWDRVEQGMRNYLDTLTAEMLSSKPLTGEDKDLVVWQVLLHVVNHGTDHRAQLLRQLNDLGVKTTSQDYIFYVYENLV